MLYFYQKGEIIMDQVKIGKFIAELRKEKNMTQQQLGDKIGVSFKTISKNLHNASIVLKLYQKHSL